MKKSHGVLASAVAALVLVSSRPALEAEVYVPQASYCWPGPVTAAATGSPLCSTIPGNIGDDPALNNTVAYNGINGQLPQAAAQDVQTPFDNLSWQMFVALNWTAGKQSAPAEQGLKSDGPRVWETWKRVADVFGNGPVQANCTVPAGYESFSIASNGQGQPVGQNEEYIQAATDEPAIDVSGNWTLYERRLNNIEIAYLKAPGGNASWTLTTLQGQKNLAAGGGKVDFPSIDVPGAPTGAIELKAAWRVLDPAKHAENVKKYYVVRAVLGVAPDLVKQQQPDQPKPICATVDLGLVAMHIIERNPKTKNALKPEWFWSTFEHVDNVPLAQNACDPNSPSTCGWYGNLDCTAQLPSSPPAYSYFNTDCPDCTVNKPPQLQPGGKAYIWNATEPFAKGYLVEAQSHGKAVTVGTQISRCWNIYALTQELNAQWRGQLASIGSVFQNYMLVGTQWGASTTNTPDPKVPSDAVPAYLSNSVVETYLQTLYTQGKPFNTGSCVSCHSVANLPGAPTVSSNLSFLPGLAQPALVRRKLSEIYGHK